MNLTLTLLTFFLGGEPTAVLVPPEPKLTAGAITVEAAFEPAAPVSDHLGLPRIAPPARHISPSWMVAVPPASRPAAFDVFSPAVRPPHEFPGLFPCGPVALVPCPPPLPATEPPAVRHVSFLGEGADFRVADREQCAEHGPAHYSDPYPYPRPHPMAFLPGGFGPDPLFQLMWEQAHAPQFAPQPHHVAACEEGQVCPPAVQEMVCPAGLTCPVGATPFPGAKNVQHVVRATYEVGPKVAEALSPFLESSDGVFGYQIDGEEVTINATAPAQMAIATFLSTVVSQPQSANRPSKLINIKHTQTKACTGECAANKCCNGDCACKDKCECCCNKKVRPATSDVSTSNNSEASGFRCTVGTGGCKVKIPALSEVSTSKTTQSGIFRFFIGLQDCKTCPSSKTTPVAVGCPVSQPNSDQVKIHATSNGILVQKADGTQIRADRIELETSNISKLEIAQGGWVTNTGGQKSEPVVVKIQTTSEGVLLQSSDGTSLRAKEIQLETGRISKMKLEGGASTKLPRSQPVKAAPYKVQEVPIKPDPAAFHSESETDPFQLNGPYSNVTEPEKKLTGFFGITR